MDIQDRDAARDRLRDVAVEYHDRTPGAPLSAHYDCGTLGVLHVKLHKPGLWGVEWIDPVRPPFDITTMAAKCCEHKHAKHQPTNAEWACPKCGAPADIPGKVAAQGWIVDEGVSDDCELLHEEDGLVCYQCGHGCSGREFSRLAAKKASRVKCPTCKGSGMVQGVK